MRPAGMRVLLTGASGGIGRAVARRLLEEGAQVLLAGRDGAALQAAELVAFGDRARTQVADLTRAADRAALCDLARQWRGGIDVLINCAGVNPFSLYEDLPAAQIDQVMAVNLLAPMHLCRELVPWLRTREAAVIVNVGSVLGAIGQPGAVAYSASKFGLRGFSEALRRELADSRVTVKYLAPRATRTAMNSTTVQDLNRRLGVAMDPPERVANELIKLLTRGRGSAVVGWPEKLFCRVNALLPGIVDRALRRQLPVIRASTPQPENCR